MEFINNNKFHKIVLAKNSAIFVIHIAACKTLEATIDFL